MGSEAERDVSDMLALAEGDRQALAALYDRHAQFLFALALRFVGDRATAEDLVHDVFLDTWRHAGEYDPTRASVAAWLRLRTRSRALDRLKSHTRARTQTLDTEALHKLVEPTVSPEQHAVAAAVRGALRTLPPEQREAILCGYFEGMSSSEIAEALHVPVGTVKSRVSAAMAKLRSELLGKEGKRD